MLLLDYARSLDVAMGSVGMPGQGSRHIGWTTNKETVEKLRKAGATAVSGYGVDPFNPSIPSGRDPKSADTPMGWEVSFTQNAEAILEAQAA